MSLNVNQAANPQLLEYHRAIQGTPYSQEEATAMAKKLQDQAAEIESLKIQILVLQGHIEKREEVHQARHAESHQRYTEAVASLRNQVTERTKACEQRMTEMRLNHAKQIKNLTKK